VLFLDWLLEMTQVKKVYRRALKKGKEILSEKIDLEDIENSLLERDVKMKDIETSISLISCILYLHNLVFPEDETIRICFCYKETNRNVLAVVGKRSYQVASKGIYEKIRKMNRRIIIYNKDGSPKNFDELPYASYQEIILAIAAHEVRHQVQNKNIAIFSPQKKYEGIIDSFVGYYGIVFGKNLEYEDVEDPKARVKELDARVIEGLILSALQDGAEESEICRIIKLEG